MAKRNLEHLELLTIKEKDEQYITSWIERNVQEIAQRVLGVRRWIQYKSAITFLSRFSYFGLSSCNNIRTPGEEYCEARRNSSDFFRNFLAILFNNEIRLPSEIPKLYATLLKDIHLVSFFLFGDFCELPKRVTSLSYSTYDVNTYQSRKIDHLFKLIGLMSIVKLVINVVKESETLSELKVGTNESKPQLQAHPNRPTLIPDSSMMCHLCSEGRVEPTSTICGHIFCWQCIHHWLKERPECPICRTPTEPSRLIHLINFK